MTEDEAQSCCFALKKLTFDDQLPNRPKGASKLPSFHASLVVCTHLAVYRGSKSTSFFCLLVSNEAHVVSIGAQGPGIFAQLTREQKPKPDKALKASATSVNQSSPFTWFLAVRTQAAKVTFFLQQTSSCRLLGALHDVVT